MRKNIIPYNIKFLVVFFLLIFSNLFVGCYSIKQSYFQLKLLMKEKPLVQAIEENKSNLDRLTKLNLVKPLLEFTEKEIHLTPKSSYQKFIELNSPYVVWVVQASDKRALKLKTWWFPFVGSQPYLGFFQKEDALVERQKLNEENYDVVMGGVKAFSLLGYFSDPLYSSMLDGVSLTSFIDTLIHETVHRTIYVKGDYAFNENLASFIARKGTEFFLTSHPELNVHTGNYREQFNKNKKAELKFQQFLSKIKYDLEFFYNEASKNNNFKNENKFLKARQEKFDKISDEYTLFMKNDAKGSDYEFSFTKGKFNNATLLSYAVYEEDQEPLETLFQKSHSNLKEMVDRLKICLDEHSKSDQKIWESLSYCFK